VVGAVTHHAPDARPSCDTGAWVLQLDRQTLEQTDSIAYPLCDEADAGRLKAKLKAITSSRLVIVNGFANSGSHRILKGLGDAMKAIGAPAATFSGVDVGTTTYSLVGVAGMAEGQAEYAFGTAVDEKSLPAHAQASIEGTLAPDNHTNYTLTHLDYALHDISVSGDIRIDSARYPVPGGRTDGFHVLVVDRRSLATVADTF